MALEQFSYVAEIVGVIAVIASLIYVGIQVKQNTISMRTSPFDGPFQRMFSLDLQVLGDEETAELILRLSQDPGAASDSEWARFTRYCYLLFSTWQTVHMNISRGIMDEEDRCGWQGYMKKDTAGPGFERFWRENRLSLVPSFRSYIDEEIFPPAEPRK